MTSPGRVLILDENLSFPFDNRVRREARALSKAGYVVSVISPKGERFDTAARDRLEDIQIYRYAFTEAGTGLFAYLVEYLQALFCMSLLALRVFLTRGFDVIHLCNPPDLLFLVALPYKLLGRRILFDHHDLCPETYQTQKDMAVGKGPVHAALRILERATFAAADVVISTNESYREVAVTRGGKSEDRVFVVRNGPDLQRLVRVPEKPELKKGKEHLVFYIGNMSKQDGIDYLLRAVRHLVHERGRRDFHTILVGGGPILDRLRAYAAELGLAEHVTFTGRIPDPEVMAALSTSSICASPDPRNPLNDVSTMQKTMEYMAMGKPVVAFDLIETRVSAGDAALYAVPNSEADFGDKIATLLDDAALRRELGAVGERRVHEVLSWEYSVAPLLAAYRKAFSLAGKLDRVPPSAAAAAGAGARRS